MGIATGRAVDSSARRQQPYSMSCAGRGVRRGDECSLRSCHCAALTQRRARWRHTVTDVH
eukprot:4234887-Prymnesium_polylepis.2